MASTVGFAFGLLPCFHLFFPFLNALLLLLFFFSKVVVLKICVLFFL